MSKYTRYLMCVIVSLCVIVAAGCGGSGGGSAPDTTAPTVSSTVPVNAAEDVAINSAITATFSEEMDPLTITDVTFTIEDAASVTGTVDYTGVTAVFTPDAVLAASTEYTATITIASTDLAGNALEADKVWTFTTGAAPDAIAPKVSSTVPANAAVGVVVNSAVTATFSEPMNPLTITTETFTIMKGAESVTGMVTYAGVTATFRSDAALAYLAVYTGTITTGAEDLAGNPLAVDKVWTFTTGAAPDTTAPTASSTVPANAAVDVAVNSAITATFSEAMNPLTITTATFTIEGAESVTGMVTYAGVTATFTPAAVLADDTEYTATITTGAKDLAGNALAADKVWTFTTGAAPDDTAPTVSSTVPVNAAANVAVNSNVSATFSEAMDPLTLTTDTFTLKQGAVEIEGAVTCVGVIATFNPDVNLTAALVYTATITTGVKDLAGNPLAGVYIWTFTADAAAIANPAAPVLGEAGRFVILASQKVTTTGTTAISGGDIAIEDQARSYYEGFTAGGDPGQFIELTGGLSYAHDDTAPALIPVPYASTIAFIDQVRTDLGIAYSFLAADPNPSAPTQVCPIELGDLTLTRGVYKTAADVTIQTGNLTLDAKGDPDSVWVFTIDGTFTTGAPGGNIILINSASAENVYWRVAGVTAIGAGTDFSGNVFAWEQVNVLSGVAVTGRLFSVNEQVTLIGDTVTKP